MSWNDSWNMDEALGHDESRRGRQSVEAWQIPGSLTYDVYIVFGYVIDASAASCLLYMRNTRRLYRNIHCPLSVCKHVRVRSC